MSRKKESLFDVLVLAPWWVSILFAAAAYALAAWIAPAFLHTVPLLVGLSEASQNIAPFLAGLFLIPAGLSVFFRKRGLANARRVAVTPSSRKTASLLDTLVLLPWWVSVLLSGLAYGAMYWLAPLLGQSNPILQPLSQVLQTVAPVLAVLLLLPAPISILFARKKRRLLDRQQGLATIRELDWKAFEWLVGEAYRRQGFQVLENPGSGADGGIDIMLSKAGQTILVQCKHWRSSKVGVSVVRELYGVLKAEGADRGIVICTGDFTADARQFAQGKEVDLLGGDDVANLVREVQEGSYSVSVQEPASPICPRCSSVLIQRLARKGPQAGQSSWGCSGFPQCRHTQAIG